MFLMLAAAFFVGIQFPLHAALNKSLGPDSPKYGSDEDVALTGKILALIFAYVSSIILLILAAIFHVGS